MKLLSVTIGALLFSRQVFGVIDAFDHQIPESFIGICKGRQPIPECLEALDYLRENVLPAYLKEYKLSQSERLARDRKDLLKSNSKLQLDGGSAGVAISERTPEVFTSSGHVGSKGNDAFYMDNMKFLIADGVGRDGSSNFFAVELIKLATILMEVVGGRDLNLATIKEILGIIVKLVSSLWLPGASTLSFGILDDLSGRLWLASVGDSAIKVYRNGEELFGTLEGCKSAAPAYINAWSLPKELLETHQESNFLQINSVDLQPGDLILAATDGLWDNLRPAHIKNILSLSSLPPPKLAEKLVRRAAVMAKQSFRSCDSQDTLEECYGACLDDITAILCRVEEANPSKSKKL